MLDIVKYVNHKGESVTLTDFPFFTSAKNLRAFAYAVTEGKLSPNGSKEFTLQTVYVGKEKNKLYDIFDEDSINNKLGRLYVNDEFIRCNMMGMPNVIGENNNAVALEFSFLAPSMEWLTEKKFILSTSEDVSNDMPLDFPYDIEYDLSIDRLSSSRVRNDSNSLADFKLEFEAATSNVNITIGNNIYEVFTDIGTGEKFVLDTLEKNVQKSTAFGFVDLFPATSDTNYIFKKIEKGSLNVLWNGKFPIYITVYEHRRSPKWI